MTALAVLLAAGCTGGDARERLQVQRTVDLDAAVGTDVTVLDLAPGSPPVALVRGGDGGSWLVTPTTGVVQEVPAAEPGSELVIADDGMPLVVGTVLTRPDGTVLPLPGTGPPSAAVLDGDTLYLAHDEQLTAVDARTGEAGTTATAPGRVTHLARTPDGLAALVHRDGVELLRLTPDLRHVGDPVAVVPEEVGTPTDLQVTADGTVVVTAYTNEAQDAGRLVTVVDGVVRTQVDLEGTDDTALDVAVDGDLAYLVLSASYHPAELTAVDLATGEVTTVAGLCGGAGAFGAIAADGGTVTVVGSCLGAHPATTAFVIG
ncbi:hypothetical protein [Geodermatophilus telluris]|uniref:hypothetical protein n=1 Tax=Geodermatophilus telluris TaxID=1190417 RepID=UPI0015872C41|nr:hypothetical protein [Geodermatophilus telluris]